MRRAVSSSKYARQLRRQFSTDKKAPVEKVVAESSTPPPPSKPLHTTPPPTNSTTSASSSPTAINARASGVRLFAEGAVSISLIYGIFWGVETQTIVPVKMNYLEMQSMCAGGAGVAFALRNTLREK